MPLNTRPFIRFILFGFYRYLVLSLFGFIIVWFYPYFFIFVFCLFTLYLSCFRSFPPPMPLSLFSFSCLAFLREADDLRDSLPPQWPPLNYPPPHHPSHPPAGSEHSIRASTPPGRSCAVLPRGTWELTVGLPCRERFNVCTCTRRLLQL